MAAFEAAIEMGFEYLETDAQATADGRLVVFHDDTLERLTGAAGRISGKSWDEVRRLRIAGKERIPLVAELLCSFPDAKINIDPKQDDAVEPLLALLREMHAWERVCVGSFSASRLDHLRQAAGSKLCTSATRSEVTRLWLTRFGLPFKNRSANCLQVPPYHRRIKVIDRRFIRAAHDRGLPVHAWTINSEPEMTALIEIGVDGIMTDNAELAMQLFNERYWRKSTPSHSVSKLYRTEP